MCKAVSGKSKEELLSVAQEIAFAKALASNDKALRDRALKKLKRWFSIKSRQDSPGIRFTEEGFMRLWKGLFYCVWMSDKPLVQEECVENISNLIHCFTELEDVQKFIRCFFQSISQAWFGLDSHRLDKYLMLVRRFLRQMLEYLYKEKWETGKVEAICKDLYKSLLLAPVGLNLHLSEIYLEELAKVGRGELDPSTVLEMIKPFADFMQFSDDIRILKSLTNCLFLQLLRQSDEGIKHQAKFEVWRQMGFPEGDIDVIQEASDEEEFPLDDGESEKSKDEDEESEALLDPRAGNVDVYLAPIDFNAESIRQYLLELMKSKDCTTKARKIISVISKKYETFSQGRYPLGIHKIQLLDPEDEEEIIEKTAENLLAEEKAAVMEGKQKKEYTFDIGWKVSPLQDQCIIENNKLSASAGKWQVENIPKKRKVQCDNLVATMKRIKVTLDDTLTTTNNHDPENMETVETVPDSTGTENNLGPKSLGGTRKRKRKKNKNLKTNNSASDYNLNVNSSDKNELILNSQVVLTKIIERKKMDENTDDWGFSKVDWETATENKVKNTCDLDTPGNSEVNINYTTKKKPVLGSKVSPSKNVAINEMLNSSKKVSFHLNRNTSQEEKEYKLSLKNSPSVPFDAEKKPRHSVLKSCSVFSPINPFL